MNRWALGLMMMYSLASYAQEDVQELVTDRPDQTESSSTVPNNSLQIETGFVFQSDKILNGGLQSSLYNTTLLRFGLFQSTELRLGFEYLGEKFVPETGEQITQRGMSPLYAGVKYRLAEEHKWFPEMAVLTSLSMPFTADEYYRIDYVTPAIRLAFSHTLSQKTGLGYNLGMEWDGIQLQPLYIYTVAAGFGVAPKLSTFVELYGSWGEALPTDHRADAGITLLLFPNIQFDASAGIGITDSSPDFFVGFGFSYRIPH